MALTYDDITSKTQRFIVPKLVDNIYKASPVFTRLRTQNAERFEGGIAISQPIMYAELRGGAFTRGGTFDISYVQTDTALQVLPKYLKSRYSAQHGTNRVNSVKISLRQYRAELGMGLEFSGCQEGVTASSLSPTIMRTKSARQDMVS